MNAFLAPLAARLGAASDALGRLVLAPIGLLPGWLSATLVASATGVLLLAVFKHTSNQKAIQRVRDGIDADLLSLRLFKDSTAVTLRAQARMIAGAVRLTLLALVPMLVMALPVTLLLGQLSLWYQARPIRPGEEAVVTLALNGGAKSPWPSVRLRPSEAAEVAVGPVRLRGRREVCWKVVGRRPGLQRLVFDVGGRAVEKQLAVGEGPMRVSPVRPAWDWEQILLNPAETPFAPDSPVRSIEIDYPSRPSWTSGTDSWLVYWFVVSMVAALAFRRVLDVKV